MTRQNQSAFCAEGLTAKVMLRRLPSPAVSFGILQKNVFPCLKNRSSAAAEAPDGRVKRFMATVPVGSMVLKFRVNSEKISASAPDNESRETFISESFPSAASCRREDANRYEENKSDGSAKLKSVFHWICCPESAN